MGLSTIRVQHNIDAEYTLSELLELFGSPKKAKETLKNLETATNRIATERRKLQTVSETQKADFLEISSKKNIQETLIESKQKKLDEDKQGLIKAHEDNMAIIKHRCDELDARQANLDGAVDSHNKQARRDHENLKAEQNENKKILEEANRLNTAAQRDKIIAKSYQKKGELAQAAADEKMDNLRKAIG